MEKNEHILTTHDGTPPIIVTVGKPSLAEGVDEVGIDIEKEVEAIWKLMGGDYYLQFPEGDKMGLIMYCFDRLRTNVLEPLRKSNGQSGQGGEGKSILELLSKKASAGHINGYLTKVVRLDDAIQAAELYASQKPQTQEGWVSVKDRLPDEHETILVCTDRHYVTQAFYFGGFRETYSANHLPDVTHWMPLPPPPTNEQNQFNKTAEKLK